MNALLEVVTIAEAARFWRKHQTSVKRARDSKYHPLEMRETGHPWLVTVASLKRRWGEPHEPLTSLLD